MPGPHGLNFLDAAANRIDELRARACPQSTEAGLLVALSGGPDSVALLLAAHHWSGNTGKPLAAVHLNHKLRSGASDQDAEFCREICGSLGVPLNLEEADPRPVAQRRGLGLEEAGRHLRLGLFRRILEDQPHLGCVAKGHHRNDQAETVIMRLFRGTGPGGLTGIQPVSGPFIHPLLGFSRSEILQFLEQKGQPWRSDASNLDGSNTRARLRRELLPLARELFGPGCDLVPARLGELLALDQEFLDQLAGQELERLTLKRGTLDIPGLLAIHPALAQRVVRLWLGTASESSTRDIEVVHVMNIFAWLREGQSGTGLDLPGSLRLVREFDELCLAGGSQTQAPANTAADFRILVEKSDPVENPANLGRNEGPGSRDEQGRWNLHVPGNVLEGNLRVRNLRPGDRFQPFGLDGTRKLSDLLQDARIPESIRKGVLLVEDDLGLLWVVGVARGERTRLLPSSRGIVTICVAER